MTAADFLRDTPLLDLSSVTRRPLLDFLTDRSVTPEEEAEPRTDQWGASTNIWPWGVESSEMLVSRNEQPSGSFLTTYVFGFAENSYFVGHSFGEFPEPIIRLVTDHDNGDRACALVAENLSAVWNALHAGAANFPDGWGLFKVRTDHDYWFFAGILQNRSESGFDLDPALVRTVREAAISVYGDVIQFPANLPGILDVLPPDRARVRNTKIAERLDTATSVMRDLKDALG